MIHPRLKTRFETIRRSLGLAYFLIAWLCAAPVQGAGPERTLNRGQVAAVIREYVLSQAPWKAENVEVRVAPLMPVSMPSGAVDYRVLKPTQGITPGVHGFLVVGEIGGKEAARFWVKAEIKIFDEVVVTSYPLARREVVTAAGVRVERRDVSSLAARPFTRIEEVLGQQTARFVEVNEVITQKTIERPTLMKRGSPIILVYETGSLRVEAPEAAEEAGKAGDLIQVKNPSSGKLLRGVVVDGRTVRIN
ncbi:MAG: flagellar basal body P-ring formation chaperone FlgA [Candidatus Binatia bacterium]|nr:flagellar basal body P-ring formation chaperone FlgA [Candidatus Binatia bacterium]